VESGVALEDLERLITGGVVTSYPNVVSGAYVFTGTRVQLYNLWDYLAAGDTVDIFLESVATAPRELAEKALSIVGDRFGSESLACS